MSYDVNICYFKKHKWETWTEVEKVDPGFIDRIWNNVQMDKNLENTILNLKTNRK